jgi:antirestriction protein ArdC
MANQVYQIITDRIIKQLEEGTVPWQKPWVGGVPMNYVSREPYKGINLFLLPRGGEYVTPKQAMDILGIPKLDGEGKEIPMKTRYIMLAKYIKKGAKKNMVVFYRMLPYTVESEGNNGKEAKKDKTYPLLRYYEVYHIDDIEGIESKIPKFEHDTIAECEKIVAQCEVPIFNNDDGAYYVPMMDYINVPDINSFRTAEEYYSVTFHEMIHSTGLESRLGRFKKTDSHLFGSQTYSFEELVAELGASMLCGITGIESVTIENSASYIQSWLKKLKNDPYFVVQASGKAQKACDYILKAEAQAESTEEVA